MIKELIKRILGIYDFDRLAEKEIKKSIKIYNNGGKINYFRSIRIYNKIRRRFNCDIYPGIKFGKNNYIAHPNNILIGKTTEIGNNNKIYPNCIMAANLKNDKFLSENNIRRHPKIMDNCIIGAGAILLGPIIIGNNSIIGAGSIVTKNVPDNTIVTGINKFKKNSAI
jgi:serine O-acetyltransferase